MTLTDTRNEVKLALGFPACHRGSSASLCTTYTMLHLKEGDKMGITQLLFKEDFVIIRANRWS